LLYCDPTSSTLSTNVLSATQPARKTNDGRPAFRFAHPRACLWFRSPDAASTRACPKWDHAHRRRPARPRSRGGTTPHATPKPRTCPGSQFPCGNDCCCPAGTSPCGPECCPTGQAECCDNACCYGECYGEERCCPSGSTVCGGSCCDPGQRCIDGSCTDCTPCGDSCCMGDTPICCQSDTGSTCTASDTECCATDADCAWRMRCDGDFLIESSCIAGICRDTAVDCRSPIDVCQTFTCVEGPICQGTPIPGCCQTDSECEAVNGCTPGRCLEDHTCNALSSCGENELCCGDTCVEGESCCPPLMCPTSFPERYLTCGTIANACGDLIECWCPSGWACVTDSHGTHCLNETTTCLPLITDGVLSICAGGNGQCMISVETNETICVGLQFTCEESCDDCPDSWICVLATENQSCTSGVLCASPLG
jgi:hypothetical protein